MKKTLHFLTAVVVTVLFFAGNCQAQKFSILVSGGYGTVKVGDYNDVLTGSETIFNLLAQEYDMDKEGSFKKISTGYEFDGELIIHIMKHFGIGLGAGYIQRGANHGVDLTAAGQYITYTLNSKFAVFPVKVSGYFFHPIFPMVNIYVTGGVGYYFGRATYTHWYEKELSPAMGYNREGEIKSSGPGFHGGIGLRFKVIPRVSFFIEGRARLCKLRMWKGDELYSELSGYTEDRSGTTWYYEMPKNSVGYLPEMATGDVPLIGIVRNVREFSFDLTGLSARIGIIVHV